MMQLTDAPRPLLKWVGGKRQLLAHLIPQVPKNLAVYAEPFAGGAALFFALMSETEQGVRRIRRTVLCDQNADLIACYRAVRSEVDAVIEALTQFRYDKDLFYEVRAQKTDGMSDVERAARLIFLNRTCFNGLFRVNSKGEFNVPFGRYVNPKIVDVPRLRRVSRALADAEIQCGDYEGVVRKLHKNSFVYFDPPYAPVSRTANFTAYAKAGFSFEEQERLAQNVHRLSKLGVHCMVSNADTPEMRALYRPYALYILRARRSVNSNSKRRGAVNELLVLTHATPGTHVVRA